MQANQDVISGINDEKPAQYTFFVILRLIKKLWVTWKQRLVVIPI